MGALHSLRLVRQNLSGKHLQAPPTISPLNHRALARSQSSARLLPLLLPPVTAAGGYLGALRILAVPVLSLSDSHPAAPPQLEEASLDRAPVQCLDRAPPPLVRVPQPLAVPAPPLQPPHHLHRLALASPQVSAHYTSARPSLCTSRVTLICALCYSRICA